MTSMLIDEVRKRPVIWDLSTDLYRDKGIKELAWQDISEVLKKPMAQLKHDWKKLRDSHRNAMKRKETKSSQAANNTKPWKYEKNMEFLLSNGRLHTTLENNVPPMTEDVMEDHQENDNSMPVDNELYCSGEEVNPTQAHESSKRHRPPEGVDKLIDYISNKKKTAIARPAPDDIDMFFGSVSLSVKKLPRRMQNRIKREVLEIISRAEEENESLMTHVSPITERRQSVTPSFSPLQSRSSSASSASGFRPINE